jgi:tetratricopeptide (TPR) repeat protein
MAKISLERKKELSQPDEFITTSHKVFEYVKANQKKIINIATVILVIVLGYSLYLYYSKTKEDKAFFQLSQDMAWYEKATQANPDAVSLEEIKKKSDTFFDSYKRTSAAMLARAKYAQLYFSKGDYSGAAKLYTELLPSARKDDGLINITLCALGQSYEAMNKPEEAMRNFETVVESSCPLKKDEALFHMGLLYEKKGDAEKSKRAFNRVVSEFPDSMYKDLAKEKIAG